MVANHVSPGPEPARTAQVGARPRHAIETPTLFDPNWRLMAPVMALVGLVTAASTGTVPGKVTLALLAAAMWLSGASSRTSARARQRGLDGVRRHLLHGLHVSLPMLLFGMAIGAWTEGTPMLSWRETIGAPVIVATLASVILNRRIASIIAATVSIWLGVALVSGSFVTILLLAGGVAIGVYAAVRQVRSDRTAAEMERERHRNQLRAEQLLNEFEESGQGWFFETDRRGALVYVSPTIGKVLGTSQPVATDGRQIALAGSRLAGGYRSIGASLARSLRIAVAATPASPIAWLI